MISLLPYEKFFVRLSKFHYSNMFENRELAIECFFIRVFGFNPTIDVKLRWVKRLALKLHRQQDAVDLQQMVEADSLRRIGFNGTVKDFYEMQFTIWFAWVADSIYKIGKEKQMDLAFDDDAKRFFTEVLKTYGEKKLQMESKL